MKIAAKTRPCREKLSLLWDIGYRHIEVFTDQSILAEPESVEMLNEYDFEYVVHAPTDHLDIDVIDFAKSISACTINTHKICTHEKLQELVDEAVKSEITITVENDSYPATHQIVNGGMSVWPPDPLCSAADVHRLQELVPGIMVCLDIEHAELRREYNNWVNELMPIGQSPHIGHVHLTGYDSSNPKGYHKPVQESPLLVENTIHYLVRSNYEGFLVCEHDMQFHTLEIWKEALNFCAKHVKDNTAEETLR